MQLHGFLQQSEEHHLLFILYDICFLFSFLKKSESPLKFYREVLRGSYDFMVGGLQGLHFTAPQTLGQSCLLQTFSYPKCCFTENEKIARACLFKNQNKLSSTHIFSFFFRMLFCGRETTRKSHGNGSAQHLRPQTGWCLRGPRD